MDEPIRGSEVFWEAALDLFEEKQAFCCHAIAIARDTDMGVYKDIYEVKIFTFLFKPDNPYFKSAWMTGKNNVYYDSEDQEHRVWAMLFMEEIYDNEVRFFNE